MTAVVREKPTQFLTVRLGADEFGIALRSIREIVPVQALTRVPGNPPWVRGVCNLRGTVLPVVDLGVRFGFGATAQSKWSMFLVLELAIGVQSLLVGVTATSVSNVIPVKEADIEAAPEVGLTVQPEYVRGLLRVKERFIVLLDPHRIFATSELVDLEAAAVGQEAPGAGVPNPVIAAPALPEAAGPPGDDPAAPGGFQLF